MPFADKMPTVVFPDNRKGFSDWEKWDKTETTIRHFCDRFADDQFSNQCANRDPGGVRAKNLCWRCVAGYVYDFKRAVEQDADESLKA